MGENKNMEKLAALQKEFFATGQTRELTFRMYQLQLLAKTIRENQEVLEAALKRILENQVLNPMQQKLDLYLQTFDLPFVIFQNGWELKE